MNILHVLSQFEVTGAEMYATSLIGEQEQKGHSTYIVSDTLSTSCKAVYYPFPIGRRSYVQRVKNVFFIVRLIRQHKIQLVHAHSRAASWVCFFATWIARTPFVSTIHGRQHLHLSSKRFNIYGRNIITISESLRGHLVRDLGIRGDAVTVIPNGFQFSRHQTIKRRLNKTKLFDISPNTRALLYVGRLSGPKGDVVRFLLRNIMPELVRSFRCSLQIIAGLAVPLDIPELVQTLQRRHGRSSARLREFQRDLVPSLRSADLVIGSGRVAMEALAEATPTIGFGESEYAGIVTKENFAAAAETNFGDTGPTQDPDMRTVIQDISEALRRPLSRTEAKSLARIVRETYAIESVAARIHNVYRQARITALSPRCIPVLMYHRVVPSLPASRHGIWVSTASFQTQMESLHRRGLTPITFREYQRFIEGENDLPAKPVILTFDDGYEDNYRIAFPILQKFSFPAVIYIVTGRIGKTNAWDTEEPQVPLLSASQIREMDRFGIEFGSHTVSHPRLPRIRTSQARGEILRSKARLEQLLGKEVLSFAYPYADFDDGVKQSVEDAEYRYAVAGSDAPALFTADFFRIRRRQVFPWTEQFGYWKKTQPWYRRYRNSVSKGLGVGAG